MAVMRRARAAVAGLAVCALLVTACGGGDGDATTATTTATTTPPAAGTGDPAAGDAATGRAAPADQFEHEPNRLIASLGGASLTAGTTYGLTATDVEMTTASPTAETVALTAGVLGGGVALRTAVRFDGALLLTLPLPAPPSADAIAGVVHVEDDGTTTVVPGIYEPGTNSITVRVDRFSDYFSGWWNPVNWIEETARGIGGGIDFVADWVTGRTDPPACRNDPPVWATVRTNEAASLHVCTQSNTADDGTERVEVYVKSNRATMQAVTVPTGIDYLWVQGQPDWIRPALGLLSGDITFAAPGEVPTFQASSQVVTLFGGQSMSFGYRRPAVDVDFDMRSFQSEAQIVANQLLGILGGIPAEGASAVALVAYACLGDFTGFQLPEVSGPAEGFVEVAEAVVKCAVELLTNPEFAGDVVREVVDAAGLDGARAGDFVRSHVKGGVAATAKAFLAAINVGGAVTRAWDGMFDAVAEGLVSVALTGVQPTAASTVPATTEPECLTNEVALQLVVTGSPYTDATSATVEYCQGRIAVGYGEFSDADAFNAAWLNTDGQWSFLSGSFGLRSVCEAVWSIDPTVDIGCGTNFMWPWVDYFSVPQLGEEAVRGSGCGGAGQLADTIPDGVWNGYVQDFVANEYLTLDIACVYFGQSAQPFIDEYLASTPPDEQLDYNAQYWLVNNTNRGRQVPLGPGFVYRTAEWAEDGQGCIDPGFFADVYADIPNGVIDSWVVIEDGFAVFMLTSCPYG